MSDDIGAPTRVAFLRNLAPGTDEKDIIQFGSPFGTISKLLLLQSKNLAFIEFESLEASTLFVRHFQEIPATIRGQRCYIKFSDKPELNSGVAPSQIETSSITNGTSAAQLDLGSGRRVLLVTLDGLKQAISIDDVFNLFNMYGAVEKISTFVKSGKNQVLVQHQNHEGAQLALANLNGRNVGVCTLLIQWSNLSELTFKRNDDRNRDYTTYNPAEYSSALPVSALHAALGYMSMPGLSMGSVGGGSGGGGGGAGGGPGCVLFVSGLDEQQVTAGALFTLFGLYGDVQLVKILFKKRDSALVQYADPQQAQQARLYLNGLELYGHALHITNSKNMSITVSPAEDASLSASPATHRRTIYTGKTVVPPSNTLHISNIHPEVTDQQLILLFGQYATVVAFEFFKTTTKMAKIQLDTVSNAASALIALNFYTLQLDSGKACTLHLAFSKHSIHPTP